MKEPTKGSEITKEWVQFVLESYHRDRRPGSSESEAIPKVEVIDFFVVENEAGLGFNCQMASLNIRANVKKGKETYAEEYSLMVKLQPSEPFQREVNKRFDILEAEHAVYSTVMNELNEFSKSLGVDQFRINIPEVIYGKWTPSLFLLVMENLKMKGFDVADKRKGLDYAHITMAIDQICRFHAISYAYNKKVNLLEKYPCFKFNADMYAFVGPIIDSCIGTLVDFLNLREKTETAERLKENAEKILQKGTRFEDLHKKNTPVCLVHGDFWNNNIMFQYVKNEDGSQRVVDCKIIDWSNVVLGNPVFDLQYFIYTSTTRETRQSHLEAILHQYHDTFMKITRQLGYEVKNWTYHDFLEAWHELDHIGFLFGFLLASVTLSQNNEWHRPKQPSIFDHAIFYPVRIINEYFKIGVTKVMVPVLYKTRLGAPIIKLMCKLMMGKLRQELVTGENEVYTSRVLGLLCEADERGLFAEPFS